MWQCFGEGSLTEQICLLYLLDASNFKWVVARNKIFQVPMFTQTYFSPFVHRAYHLHCYRIFQKHPVYKETGKKMVKQSRNRSGVAQRVPGGLGSHISWHMKVVRLSASRTGHLYPQEMFLILIFSRGWVDPRAMVRWEVICHWKIQWHHRESIRGPSD